MDQKEREGERERNESPLLKSSLPESRERGSRFARVHPFRRLTIYTHSEIEIANNDATEQNAPLTLICIRGVRIVSISNAVYT